MRLSILDQSPIISGHAPAQAIHATLELARAADRLGYHRYWLAEHHAMKGLADPCPEILLGQVAAQTTRIRVGTGGVLLPYYSPLKVAEVFRMYEALFPGRIDLGVGRAPGGNLLTARAMNAAAFGGEDQFPTQVQETLGYLDDALPPDYPFHAVKAMPAGPTSPQVWLLGSSDFSGSLAAYLGLRFSFAHFINAQGGDLVTRAYRERYQASGREAEPHAAVCCFVICAESDAEAERLARVVDSRRLDMAYNLDTPVPTQEQAEKRSYTDQERAHIQSQRGRLVHGSADTCKEKLMKIAEQFSADELMVLTITGDYATRLDSYERLARAFELPGAASG